MAKKLTVPVINIYILDRIVHVDHYLGQQKFYNGKSRNIFQQSKERSWKNWAMV